MHWEKSSLKWQLWSTAKVLSNTLRKKCLWSACSKHSNQMLTPCQNQWPPPFTHRHTVRHTWWMNHDYTSSHNNNAEPPPLLWLEYSRTYRISFKEFPARWLIDNIHLALFTEESHTSAMGGALMGIPWMKNWCLFVLTPLQLYINLATEKHIRRAHCLFYRQEKARKLQKCHMHLLILSPQCHLPSSTPFPTSPTLPHYTTPFPPPLNTFSHALLEDWYFCVSHTIPYLTLQTKFTLNLHTRAPKTIGLFSLSLHESWDGRKSSDEKTRATHLILPLMRRVQSELMGYLASGGTLSLSVPLGRTKHIRATRGARQTNRS